jgi:hypothetical protein
MMMHVGEAGPQTGGVYIVSTQEAKVEILAETSKKR